MKWHGDELQALAKQRVPEGLPMRSPVCHLSTSFCELMWQEQGTVQLVPTVGNPQSVCTCLIIVSTTPLLSCGKSSRTSIPKCESSVGEIPLVRVARARAVGSSQTLDCAGNRLPHPLD